MEVPVTKKIRVSTSFNEKELELLDRIVRAVAIEDIATLRNLADDITIPKLVSQTFRLKQRAKKAKEPKT